MEFLLCHTIFVYVLPKLILHIWNHDHIGNVLTAQGVFLFVNLCWKKPEAIQIELFLKIATFLKNSCRICSTLFQ